MKIGDIVKVVSQKDELGWIVGKPLIITLKNNEWCCVSPVEDISRQYYFTEKHLEVLNEGG